VLYSALDFIAVQIQTDLVKPIPIERRMEYMEPIESKTELYHQKGWTDYDMIANEKQDQLGFQFSMDESAAIFNQPVPKQRFSFTQALTKTLPKLVLGYGVGYEPCHELIVDQTILGYRVNKKWSIQGRFAEDFYYKNIFFEEMSLGVEFRKNLNNAGYPVFLGTSVWISNTRFRGNKDDVKKQSFVTQLSLSKRTSKFFTFEFFVNYPIVIHSNTNINYNTNHLPQMGINIYLY
jgi:hypothetical protein